MNKKFSTLVASLLLSSAFSVYAGNAKPMLATPTQVETRATSADVEKTQLVTSLPDVNNLQYNYADGTILPGYTDNSRLYVLEDASTLVADQYVRYNQGAVQVGAYSNNGSFYWNFVDGQLINNSNQVMSIQGRDHFEIIPVETVAGEGSRFFVLGTRDADGKLYYVTFDASASTDLKFRSGSETNINNAAIFCSVATAFEKAIAKTAKELNEELGGGFNLSIASLINEDATISGAEVFAGKLTAMVDKNTPADATHDISYNYMLQNEAGKFIVFEKGGVSPSDQNAQKGTFKLVGKNEVDSYVDGQKGYNRFNIYAAHNGSKEVIVKVLKSGATNNRLYIANTGATFALSMVNDSYTGAIDALNYAVTSLVADNYVNLKQFLTGQFYTVEFVSAKKFDDTNEYKKGGILAINEDILTPEFVAASGVYEKAPEAQWAISYNADNGSIKLVNRENPSVSTSEISALRTTNTANVYEIVTTDGVLADNDCVKITAVAEHDKHDGYAVFSANDLRNKTWYLGQVRQAEGDAEVNVYWAENHGTHQIGATVEETNASRWNLSLVNKAIADHTSEVDSVLTVSTLYTWNDAKNRADAKKDTLVILPYAFQNRSNNEFVKMNEQTNLNYYICDKDNKDDVTLAQRFALKMKADGTFNYIALLPNGYEGKDDASVDADKNVITTKVYQENSTDKGTWRNMGAYKGDANALMFVKEATAPEYRKLVSENGVDTVRIYRADNHSQVVYEKRDAKSVVDGRTLSFLNIDNETQFTEINPALYVDTAYVNRGNNTRYQYLLGVNVTEHKGYYCEDHGFAEERPCEHAVPVAYKTGRYLINMIDTANVYGANVNIHNNPYINETEEGLDCAKLSFVDAIHVLEDADATKTDKLYIINNADSKDKYTVIDLSTPDFNIAKFAFKYVDSMEGEEFKIQTLYKEYIAPSMEGATDAEFRAAYANDGSLSSEEGYLRWVNGCLVVDKTYQKGDVFDMNEDETRTPTANEEITAEGSVVVAGVNGAVVVKGAEGKSVIVSTILGKVVANEVLTSDNAQITAPAGVVVVSVDGESFKVVVK